MEFSGTVRLSEVLAEDRLEVSLSGSGPAPSLTLFWGRPAESLGLYLDRSWSQYYFEGSPSAGPFFIEETVGEPRLCHQVADAFLSSAGRELEKSLLSWTRREAGARHRQRAYSDACEALAHGLHAVEVEVLALRVGRTGGSNGSSGPGEARLPPSFAAARVGTQSDSRRVSPLGALDLEVRESQRSHSAGRIELKCSPEEAEGSPRDFVGLNIGRSFCLFVGDAKTALRLTLKLDDRYTSAFTNDLLLLEELGDEIWLPLLPTSHAQVNFEFSVLVKKAVRSPTAYRRVECALEDYHTLSYSWLWFLGLPSLNPLMSEEDEVLDTSLPEICDRLLPADDLKGIVRLLTSLQHELLTAKLEMHALIASEDSSFRSSKLKNDPRFQALPTNLHAQLLLRLDNEGGVVDALHNLTAGCMSPHGFGHGNGGLSRLEDELSKLLNKVKFEGSRWLNDYEISSINVGRRKLFAVCQSVSIAVCALYLKLQMFSRGYVSESTCRSWTSIGFPIIFEGLLSMTNLIGKEKGMVEDCISAIDALR